MESSKMIRGTVKFYSIEKQFGFLRPDDGGKDVFFHISACAEDDPIPVGTAVTFEVGNDTKSGKVKATTVDLV
jgi:cold shock protein